MIRLLGGTLVAAGAAWMGFRASAALKARARALGEMGEGLALLEQELELDSPPMPLLMDRLILRSRGPAKKLFQDCGRALDRLSEEEFSLAWRRLVGELEELGEEGRQALMPLGEVLGRCSCREERQGVEGVRRRLETLRERTEEEYRRQGRVYQTLGLSGGAFLVILLM